MTNPIPINVSITIPPLNSIINSIKYTANRYYQESWSHGGKFQLVKIIQLNRVCVKIKRTKNRKIKGEKYFTNFQKHDIIANIKIKAYEKAK